MKRFLPAVFLPALLVAQQPSDAGFRPISLQDAVALAQKNAPAAVQAQGAIQNARGTVKTTYNQFFPTLSGSLGHSQGAGQVLDNGGKLIPRVSRPQYSTSLAANYTLWDGGKRVYDLRARNADLDALEVAADATQFTLALQVKQQYFAILAARESEAAAKLALDLAQQQLDASVAKVRAGAAIISDSLRSAIAVGNAQLTLLNAQNSVRNTSLTLTRLVESPVPVSASASDTAAFAITPIDSAAIVAAALDGPSVRQAKANLVSADAAVRSAKSAWWPSLSTSLRYGGNGYDMLYGLGGSPLAYSNTFSLNLSFPIWDGYARSEAVHRARTTVTTDSVQVADAKLLAQQNIQLQISTLRTAEQRIRIQQLSVQAAQEDLRVQQQRYALGSSTLLDLTTSVNSLNAARQALIQARLDYRTSRAQIEAIIGRDLR
jgi:outer membrane protein